MRTLLFFTLIFLSSITYSISQEQSYDFRKSRWGMTKAQVKATEKTPVELENEKEVNYLVKVAGIKTQLGYIFLNDRLVRSIYIFQDSHTNKNHYIEDYKKVKEILTRKYGQPTIDDVIWRDNHYKNRSSKYGMAIILGELMYRAQWVTHRTQIRLVLSGDNYKAKFGTLYYSVKDQGDVDSANKNEEEAQF